MVENRRRRRQQEPMTASAPVRRQCRWSCAVCPVPCAAPPPAPSFSCFSVLHCKAMLYLASNEFTACGIILLPLLLLHTLLLCSQAKANAYRGKGRRHTHTHRLACFHMCVWVFLRCAHISDGKLKVNWDVSPSMKAVGLAHTMCAWNEAQNTVHTRYSSHISVLMYELVMPAVLLLLMLWWSWSSFSATDYRGNVALRCFCSRQYCTNTF